MATTKIASVTFYPVTAKRRYRGMAYTIPAVDLNADPKVILAHDLFEHDEGATVPGTNKRAKHQYLVKGEEIARCVIGEWTGTTVHCLGTNPNCHPGIWLVRDKLPVIETQQKIVGGESLTAEERMVVDAAGNQVWRDASPDEIREMWEEDLEHARKADRAYAEWCWNAGNRIWNAWQNGSKEPVPREMPPLYKAAARHYGLDAEWLKEAASQNSVPCKHCEKIISKTSMLCMFCQEPQDLQKWARWKAEKELALQAAMNPVAPPPPPLLKPGIANRPAA